ncbi:MAG TPA: FtsQ-type POTRA domain-containing protein [Gaiellaceae bacterium]
MAEQALQLHTRRRARPRADLARFLPSGRSIVVGLGLIAAVAGMYALARGTSMFAVERIDVRGASPAVASQVETLLRAYQGRSLVGVDGASVEHRVGGLSTVRSAVVDRAFPHTLTIRVQPEIPVAVLRRGGGSWLVSARGRVIAPVARGTHRSLPRIWLPQQTDITVGSLLGNDPGGLAARSLSTFVGSGFTKRISFVRALQGQITLGLRGGLEVLLGAPLDLPLKIGIVRGLLPTFAPVSQGGPTYLDVTVPERPVAGRNPQVSG